jgi:hypothetical protein
MEKMAKPNLKRETLSSHFFKDHELDWISAFLQAVNLEKLSSPCRWQVLERKV